MNPPDFDIVFSGSDSHIELCQSQANSGLNFPKILVPFGLPTVIPNFIDELEVILAKPENLSIYKSNDDRKFIGRTTQPERLFSCDFYPPQTTLSVVRNHTTGEILDLNEDAVPVITDTVRKSTSLHRPPGPPSDGIYGSSSGIPFWPGGLEEPALDSLGTEMQGAVDLDKDLLTSLPGLISGMNFTSKSSDSKMKFANDDQILEISKILDAEDFIDWKDEAESQPASEKVTSEVSNVAEISRRLDEVIKLDNVDSAALLTKQTTPSEWAIPISLDTPINDFHTRVPNMAHKWKFELDSFQKWAIIHLEQHNDVFVAAHTSAGKTVVAEYAIALGLDHMTKVAYTSPIKALSNQKFREFRNTFGDKNIGLVTGDVQMNSDASCVIMTTEILRSLLYRGSDFIRDLEWVIFDEIHYVNDPDRGVVWEEVLIMLPQHVSIIMLSATVPNPLEFAEWVGRIKKRCVYVISTTKRPIPLEHYLFTGNSSKTANELFLLVDSSKKFLTESYNKAVNACKERETKFHQSYGPKGSNNYSNLQQDKNTWLAVINMLRTKDKLPAVAFVFSRKRIQDLVELLSSIDLTDKSEKSHIDVFVNSSIARLKGSDQKLGQICLIRQLLRRGIGIHHSGILPIMKEIVEILFQKSLVKILFATETFAMGVNMPARTVVFDSINKFDGNVKRHVLAGEYTQMAGRAGRRGLDATGTVIIVCKKEVPEMADLHRMLLGQATHLKSQFRITYSMILKLLRVEKLRVEDMMKRSFSEFHSQKNVINLEKDLERIENELKSLPENGFFSLEMQHYYNECSEYWLVKKTFQDKIANSSQLTKVLVPGRAITIATTFHSYVPAVILQQNTNATKKRTYTVLALCEKLANLDDSVGKKNKLHTLSNAFEVRPIADVIYFKPEGACGHEVLDVSFSDISCITTKSLKINSQNIIADWSKRQQPRFRNDLPGQSISSATQDLLHLAEGKSPTLVDFAANDLDLVEEKQRLAFLQEALSHYQCTKQYDFMEQFNRIHQRKLLESDRDKVKFSLSEDSLEHLPEFKSRQEVLKRLKYIDKSDLVTMKGRSACQINSHEILITELIYNNVFAPLDPATIAALLSATVLEDRNSREPDPSELVPQLVEAKNRFLEIAQMVDDVQRSCGVPHDNYLELFRFGLLKVVYEWAQGKPFCEIAINTDVQEGIIVRCVQRLNEVLQDVKDAARIVGDVTLENKMKEASKLIKRDIIFAASLYMQ